LLIAVRGAAGMQHDFDKKVGKNDGSDLAENLQADRI